jgi:hypothetical protein
MRFGGWRLNGHHGQTGSRNSASARAQSYGPQSFQRFSCAFAQLFLRSKRAASAVPAPLRECAPQRPARLSRRSAHELRRRPPAGCVPGAGEAKNTRKRNPLFRQAKRGVSRRGRQVLEIVGRRNERFRRIVCFQGLDRLFVSRSRDMRPPGPKGAGGRIVKRPVPGPRS